MKLIQHFGPSAAILMASAMLTNAAVFTNGDFESPDLGPSGFAIATSSIDTFITGWTAATSTVTFPTGNAVYLADVGNSFIPGATSGDQVVAFNNDNVGGTTSLAQQFDTIIGQAYSVTFDLAREFTLDVTPLPTLSVVTDAAGSVALSYVATDAFTSYAYAFVASGLSTTLTFSRVALLDEGRSPVLDTVAVTAVPEPSSLGLLGLGALGLMARRRR